MSSFIEALRSVGGVKPCPKCAGGYVSHLNRAEELCDNCHGKTYTIDLAPLLAKPKELSEVAFNLGAHLGCALVGADKGWVNNLCRTSDELARIIGRHVKNLHVIGPQRAGNLIFKVAEQLGGTAVTVKPEEPILKDIFADMKRRGLCYDADLEIKVNAARGYRLSLPIPPDATVLFVTDKAEGEELSQIIQATDSANGCVTILPYILCLVSTASAEKLAERLANGRKTSGMKIISLHSDIPEPSRVEEEI